MLIMTPSPFSTKILPTACAQKKTPFRFTLHTLSHTASSNSYCPFGSFGSTNRRGILIPALFTSTSIVPNVSIVFATIASTSETFVTSVLTYNNWPSFASISGAFSAISEITTFAPIFKNSCATAFPIPDAAPVTMTVLPSNSNQSLFIVMISFYNFSSATDCSCCATFSNESHFVENSNKNSVSITDIAAILVKLT